MIRTIVIGSGPAGTAYARELSRHPEHQVTLIESGPITQAPSDLLDGTHLRGALPHHPNNRTYHTELTRDSPARGSRTHQLTRGDFYGGSSTINGGYQVRATAADYEAWAAIGGEYWSYERAIALSAALETDRDYGTETGHGQTGPVVLARASLNDPLSTAFVTGAQELGYPAEPDKNSPFSSGGVGPIPSNIINGVRVHTGMALLDPVRSRPNLTVLGNTLAVRIKFSLAGPRPRATGVHVARTHPESGKVVELLPADEVVLCAGAIETPKLLMISGIGPRADLTNLGIDLVAHLPVGTEFSDHPNLTVPWMPTTPRPGATASVPFPAALNFASPGSPKTDLEILLAARPVAELVTGNPQGDAHDLFVALQQAESRGRLSLTSRDPMAPPSIEYRYLEAPADRDRLRAGVRAALALLESAAFSEVFGYLPDSAPTLQMSNSTLDQWIRQRLGTAIHTCGTAAMGRITDGNGSVLGVDGLVVADTSILPTAPSRGPYSTAILVGSLVAQISSTR